MDTPFSDDDDTRFNPSGRLPGISDDLTENTPPQQSSASHSDADREPRSSIVAARGTSEGLVLRVDGRVDESDLKIALRDFLESRRSFLSGHDVAFEWIGKKADEPLLQELTRLLADEFDISVRNSRLRPTVTKTPESSTISLQTEISSAIPSPAADQPSAPLAVVGGGRTGALGKGSATSGEKAMSLFDGIEGFDARNAATGATAMLWDDPDARIVYGTLRSGQKIESEHSVIVFGDVNSGAEIIAGGDVVVLGTLRGIAHAGAYDESGGGRVIFSLNLQPTQLRIGLVISRGGGTDRSDSGKGAASEIARVENNMIVVEPYQSRTVWVRRRE